MREFPGGPVVRTWHFHCCGLGSIPGQGTKILQAVQCCQKKERASEMRNWRQVLCLCVCVCVWRLTFACLCRGLDSIHTVLKGK